MGTINRAIEERLQDLEDREAIRQVVSAYGYAMDGCNAEAVGELYTENGVYAVGDVGRFEGREQVAAITLSPGHVAMVQQGAAHLSTPPYIVLDGDRAVATCHTMVPKHGGNGFYIGRLSASRINLRRDDDGEWRIVHRQNWMLDGNLEANALLGRLHDGPDK